MFLQIRFFFFFNFFIRTVKSPRATVPDELQPQVTNISQRLSELEAKKREMDKIWGHPVSSSSPGWQRSSSQRSIPDWQDVTQRRDVREPVSLTRREDSQMPPPTRMTQGRQDPRQDPRQVTSLDRRTPNGSGRIGPSHQRGPSYDRYNQEPERMDTSPSRTSGPVDEGGRRLASPQMSSPHIRTPSVSVSSPHDSMSPPGFRQPPNRRPTSRPGSVDEPIRAVALAPVQSAPPPISRPTPPNGRIAPPPNENGQPLSSHTSPRGGKPEDDALRKLNEFEAMVYEVSSSRLFVYKEENERQFFWLSH